MELKDKVFRYSVATFLSFMIVVFLFNIESFNYGFLYLLGIIFYFGYIYHRTFVNRIRISRGDRNLLLFTMGVITVFIISQLRYVLF